RSCGRRKARGEAARCRAPVLRRGDRERAVGPALRFDGDSRPRTRARALSQRPRRAGRCDRGRTRSLDQVSSGVRAVVLAAGKGTRMKSARPKVLHPLCGRAMLWYVVRALRDAGVTEIVVVSNPDVADHLPEIARDADAAGVSAVIQEPQLGTGHAVQVALEKLSPQAGTLLVLNGDLPLVEVELIARA